MRVERFSLFFPPTLLAHRRGETEYAIGAIPAGGYVKITGMNPEELEDLDARGRRRAYYSQPPWKRIVVILAGPAVNIADRLRAVLGGADHRQPQRRERRSSNLDPSVHTVVTHDLRCSRVERGTPADGVLRPGDGSSRSTAAARASSSATARRSRAHRCAGTLADGCRAATPVQLTVRRGGQALTRVGLPPLRQGRAQADADRLRLRRAAKSFGVLAAAGAARERDVAHRPRRRSPASAAR